MSDRPDDISEEAWEAASRVVGGPDVFVARSVETIVQERIARAIDQARREGYAAGVRAAAEAGSMSKLELLACALAMEAGEPGRWAAYIETAKAQVIQAYTLRRAL